jgi:hypothetical protein
MKPAVGERTEGEALPKEEIVENKVILDQFLSPGDGLQPIDPLRRQGYFHRVFSFNVKIDA